MTEINGESPRYAAIIVGTNAVSHNTGDLLLLSAPWRPVTLARADPVVPIKAGEWFTEEVIADGDIITVIVQDKEVAKFKMLHHQLMSGPIGLVCGPKSRVVFRNIEIKKLNGAVVDGSRASGVQSENVQRPIDWGRMARIVWGDWQIEGDELVHRAEGWGRLLFGDPTWSDYTFSADVKIVQSTGVVKLVFRGGGEPPSDQYEYVGGLRNVFNGAIEFSSKGNLPARRTGNTNLGRGQWHKMSISVQGNRLTAYLDDRVVMATTDSSKAKGCVGFDVWNSVCRFRNPRVTAPNGKILWEGLPEMPTASTFGVSLRVGKR